MIYGSTYTGAFRNIEEFFPEHNSTMIPKGHFMLEDFKLLEYKYRELNNIYVQPVTPKECKVKLRGIERRKANG